MNHVIFSRILPFLIIMSASIEPQSFISIESPNKLLGTSTTWELDANFDKEYDENIITENLTALNSSSITFLTLKCNLTVNDFTANYSLSIVDSLMEWDGIFYFIDKYNSSFIECVISSLGISRKGMQINQTINSILMVVSYDLETGLLLSIDYLNVSNKTINYLKIKDTNVFKNFAFVFPVMIVVTIAISILAVIYTVSVSIKDKKRTSKEACFDDSCWK